MNHIKWVGQNLIPIEFIIGECHNRLEGRHEKLN